MFTLFCAIGLGFGAPASGNEGAAMGALKVAKHYYDKGDFEKAALRFHEAYKIHPNPAFLFNAARAEQRGFKLEAAERDFNEVLRRAKDPKMLKRTRLHLAEIKAYRERLSGDAAQANKANAAAAAAQKDAAAAHAEAEKARLDAERSRVEAEKSRAEAIHAKKAARAKKAATDPPMSLKKKILYGVSGFFVVTGAAGWITAATLRNQAVALETEVVSTGDVVLREDKLKRHADLVTQSSSVQAGSLVFLVIGGAGGWLTYRFVDRDPDPSKDDKNAGKSKVSLNVAPWFDGRGLSLQGAF